MATRVAINGFGRIGRLIFRSIVEQGLLGKDVEVVAIASNGIQAVQLAKEHHPDIVLLDINMPVMNGYEVAEWLRQRPSLEKLVLVALNGGREEDRRRSHAERHRAHGSGVRRVEVIAIVHDEAGRRGDGSPDGGVSINRT